MTQTAISLFAITPSPTQRDISELAAKSTANLTDSDSESFESAVRRELNESETRSDPVEADGSEKDTDEPTSKPGAEEAKDPEEQTSATAMLVAPEMVTADLPETPAQDFLEFGQLSQESPELETLDESVASTLAGKATDNAIRLGEGAEFSTGTGDSTFARPQAEQEILSADDTGAIRPTQESTEEHQFATAEQFVASQSVVRESADPVIAADSPNQVASVKPRQVEVDPTSQNAQVPRSHSEAVAGVEDLPESPATEFEQTPIQPDSSESGQGINTNQAPAQQSRMTSPPNDKSAHQGDQPSEAAALGELDAAVIDRPITSDLTATPLRDAEIRPNPNAAKTQPTQPESTEAIPEVPSGANDDFESPGNGTDEANLDFRYDSYQNNANQQLAAEAESTFQTPSTIETNPTSPTEPATEPRPQPTPAPQQSSYSVTLDSPDLGRVRVHLSEVDGIRARLVAQSEMAYHAIARDAQTITRSLEEVGVSLSDFSLEHGQENFQQPSQEQSRRNQSQPPNAPELLATEGDMNSLTNSYTNSRSSGGINLLA